ncbi:MAG: hypothetical protein ACYTHJ_20335 [Planctomycetota bacterium]
MTIDRIEVIVDAECKVGRLVKKSLAKISQETTTIVILPETLYPVANNVDFIEVVNPNSRRRILSPLGQQGSCCIKFEDPVVWLRHINIGCGIQGEPPPGELPACAIMPFEKKVSILIKNLDSVAISANPNPVEAINFNTVRPRHIAIRAGSCRRSSHSAFAVANLKCVSTRIDAPAPHQDEIAVSVIFVNAAGIKVGNVNVVMGINGDPARLTKLILFW